MFDKFFDKFSKKTVESVRKEAMDAIEPYIPKIDEQTISKVVKVALIGVLFLESEKFTSTVLPSIPQLTINIGSINIGGKL